jgi:hypothetical protein
MKPSDFNLAEIKPLPGVTPETVWAHMKRHARKDYRCENPDCMACARFPKGGGTARWIKPGLTPGMVICPTCENKVVLARWHFHLCKQVARPRWGKDYRSAY